MNKKKLFLVVAGFVGCISLSAQEAVQDTSYWKKSGSASLTFGQTSFTNWSAGGDNSISVLGSFGYKADYQKDKISWVNAVDLGYGLTYQGSDQTKNEDHINLSSNLGYQAFKNWFYAVDLTFKTQFDKGYSDYPVADKDKKNYISKLMAPGYLIGSAGMTYSHPKEDLKIFLSPISEKMTFVLDDKLSEQGAFGADSGKKFRAEFGALAKGTYTKKITENILFNTELLFTSAYKTFGNVDVDWRMSLDWKLNKYFTFKANTFLLYDDDIKHVNKDGKTVGPRVQFKEVIGLGFGYIF